MSQISHELLIKFNNLPSDWELGGKDAGAGVSWERFAESAPASPSSPMAMGVTGGRGVVVKFGTFVLITGLGVGLISAGEEMGGREGRGGLVIIVGLGGPEGSN